MADRISWIQYSHRQPAASPRKPPTSGPTPGLCGEVRERSEVWVEAWTYPMNGAALKAAIGTPRSSFFQRSARVPPTRDMGAEKETPAMKRVANRQPMLGARAPGMVKTTAKKRVTA